jgi:hypothetical protein
LPDQFGDPANRVGGYVGIGAGIGHGGAALSVFKRPLDRLNRSAIGLNQGYFAATLSSAGSGVPDWRRFLA